MIGKSNAVLLALLLALPTAFMATALIAPAVGQANYSAWLKIVTDSWDGGTYAGFSTPVRPTGIDFPGRYNATNVCVELYKFKNPNRDSPAPLNSWEGPIDAGSPNGTGFIRVSWPTGWENVTIIVKAKSYQGDCIGAGNPFTGIIVYWLTVNPTASFRAKFSVGSGNLTIGDDGIEVSHGATFNWNILAPFGSGPVDIVSYATGPITFQVNHNHPTAANAWVARAAYIFKLFHEHTWYGTDDVLTYATIFIYDTDHTPAGSTTSLIQAAITGNDGQSRYTREIFPRAQGLGPGGRFRDNRFVPIPLQSIHLGVRGPFEGGIPDPEISNTNNIQAPHLNATKRVWWETVLVNQTFYVGNEYNQTGTGLLDEYAADPATGKTRPLFGAYPANPAINPTITQGGIRGVPAGPFSLALNHTVDLTLAGFAGWDTTPEMVENVANFNNNTVFYARFCVQDADLKIQHPEVGDKLVGAEVTINLKRTGDVQPYYLSHNILETDASGCTANPHKWPGYRSEFSNFARFPNATNWGLRGSLNVSKAFDPRDDISPAWRPGGYFERAWGGDWRGPYINAGRNWSALIPEVTYMKTRTLTDDKDYDGFDVQVKWKGGSRNNYGGTAVLVDSIRVPNPYAISLLYDYVNDGPFGGWVFPYTVLANNKLWLQIHSADCICGDIIVTDPNPTMLEVMGPFTLSLTDFDSTTGKFTLTIRANGFVAVNNATDPRKTVDWALDPDDEIIIEDALVSFKKHDVMQIVLGFEAGQGQADRGVDGDDDYTTVDFVRVSGGPYELEFWPGPPGTGTVRVLVTGHDLDVCILPNNLNTCPNIRDFTGAILFKGPPRVIEVLIYENREPSGSVTGEFTTTGGPWTFTDTRTIIEITSGPENIFVVEAGIPSDSFPFSTTALIDIDNDAATDDLVQLTGQVIYFLDPVAIHYAWRETTANAFAAAMLGPITLTVDRNNDGTTDVTLDCAAGDPPLQTNVVTYHDPDTGLVTLTVTAPVTPLTCTSGPGDLDFDNTDDSYTVTLTVTMSLVYSAASWPPLSIFYVSGSISAAGLLQIDLDNDNNVDFMLPVSGFKSGPTIILVSFIDDVDRYTNTATLTCTISGTVPTTGSTTGTITCNGLLDFAIDIYGDDTIEVSLTGLPLTGTGPIVIFHDGLGSVSIFGSISVAAPSVVGDFDNDGITDDTLDIDKTVDLDIDGTINFATSTISISSGGYSVSGADIINISSVSDPPNDIDVPETGSLGLAGQSITLTIPPVVPGIILSGQVSNHRLAIYHAGVEQVFVAGGFTLNALTQVDDEPVADTTITVSISGVGSITHADEIEVQGRALAAGAPINFQGGSDLIVVEGMFNLNCIPVGFVAIRCSMTIIFDGRSVDLGLPISGTIVINRFLSGFIEAGTMFFQMEEIEEMEIEGVTPTGGNNIDVGGVITTGNIVTLEGGILSVGPIVKAFITNMVFTGGEHFLELAGISRFNPMVIRGRANGTTIAGITVDDEVPFSITLTQPVTLDISSFIVPLTDMRNDDREFDDYLFGGYDDFALTGTGMVYITAWVHDIAFKPVDNMGNTLPASNTAVTLIRYNGGPVTRGSGTNPDQFQSNLAWSYGQWAGAGTGYAIFYQLPGDQAYGVTVTFDNRPVYDKPFEIEKLTETVIEKLVTQVFKLKLVVIDCTNTPVPEAWIRYVEPGGRTVTTRVDTHGALDFGLIGGGEITVRAIWWKGVWIGFDKATIGTTELPVSPDGSVRITIDRNIDSPIVLRALLTDFIFTTWDFNQDNRIPRLNITLSWVGVHPLTGGRMYFLQTMDPNGDTHGGAFNTSLTFSQFHNYTIRHFYSKPESSAGLKSYADVRYVFYKMPSTTYNITVTTVTGSPRLLYDAETQQTPGNSKWPGRTDAAVDHEIKIDWTSHDAAPRVRKTPAAAVNDRVVLRVYMTWDGRFVTDPSLNPIGNATLYRTCGPVRIDLLTWAHTWFQRIVDGDFDYLRDARRIGNATYRIVNDNGVPMEQYIPRDRVFTPLFTSKWTEDTLLTTWLKADSQHSSTIWWNGTYRKQDLSFHSYVYPLQFTRGEQPWAKFYDRVGLTGTGWETTERKEADDPFSYVINRFFNVTAPRLDNATWPTHNFTLVGNEGLWSMQKWRWERAVARGLVPEVPWKPYSLVFEKEVLTVPIPVGFITLSLKDEDLARAVPYAVVQLDIFSRSSPTILGTRYAGYKYKVGREGNLTLLYPTQEIMQNLLSPSTPFVRNYTLTVYWYLNSSIVYKDAFNLTKRGYSVEKVAIADVTFVLAISADRDRPVKDLYARIWWFNVSTTGTGGADTVFPGRITVDHARKTWTYTAVPETRGAAKWTDGRLTLPWLPASERFTKTDYDLAFDTATGRWVYRTVTRSWDIPYPSTATGAPQAGWPYSPTPTGYYRALTFTQNFRIQYRISVWSDQLPIDPSLVEYGKGAWARAAPAAAAGDHYELVWTRLSTGDDSPPLFRFAWMLFGKAPFDITYYRGPDAIGMFQPIPGYALTRTWERTPAPGSKTVAIKLNATDIEIPVFWQVGDLELGTYDCGPLVGYIVKGQIIPPRGATYSPISIDAVTRSSTIRVGDKTVDVCPVGKPVGLVSYRSGDTVPTVVWGGSTLRITEVSPPPRIWFDDGAGQDGADNPDRGTTSRYWLDWVRQAIDPLTGRPVNVQTGDQLRIPGVDLGIQYMGYGRPYEGLARDTGVVAWSNDPDNRAHRPFIKMFEFQNVSARITDFNGRALPGAFYQLVDAQTGKSAAWSYAGPDGRIVPMPIRKPGGVFIQRVTYLGIGVNGEPTWPVNSFAKWPIAYDSRDDETTQETQKPDIPIGFTYTAEAGPWPTGPGWGPEKICSLVGDHWYEYYDDSKTIDGVRDQRPLVTPITESFASCPPAGWGRSFDVITRIFDLRLRFVYGDAQRPADPAYTLSAPALALPERFTISGQGAILDVKRLVRGTYDVLAKWPDANGVEVGRRTVDISRSNVGTVEGTVVLALRDVSFSVVDRQGRPLSGARVSVSPNLVRADDVQLRPDSIFTLLRVPDGRTYDFTIEWTSPFGTTARAAVRDTPAGLQARGTITIPVDDISVKVVDFDGRPVAGAAIRFGGQAVGSTDSQGVVIVGQVPLDNDYAIAVSKEGTEIGSDRVRFTAARTSATIQAGVYDITVLVKGAAGQPIQGALVELVRGGTTLARVATDASGSAVFTKVVGADYTVRAAYEQFSSTANLAKGTRSAQITLDLYTVLLGVPMTFATFLALIIGLILLVIVVVVIVSEYIRWRGRRLGIYPAAPPKK